ncbi:DUF6220 domain-containing protein [Microcoleus sp. CAWBG58]|uniref:DUF6220 domain-containing protein n=1 Tax=Microcoleus sp. CAWBG58 TaxID=2841651 RepID=UPI0025CC3A4B|nr:DUF6220 domain-containing protein [Microcoleus sp. CAWBG58]
MTINSEIDRDRTPMRWMPIGFYATSVVFNLCLIAQLLTVGVAYFVNPAWWDIHVWLVRGYSSLSLLLLGKNWLKARPPSREKLRSDYSLLQSSDLSERAGTGTPPLQTVNCQLSTVNC